jgi:predicted CoA-binding protein
MSETALCEIPDSYPAADEVLEILRSCRTIAVVGLSPKPERDSHKVARYLMENGYTVVPVNPGQREILGRPCFRSLEDIPFPVDMADLFIHSARVAPVVDQAIEKGVRAVWMQLGVVHRDSAAKAKEAGIRVVMNLCIMQEHKRLALGPPA